MACKLMAIFFQHPMIYDTGKSTDNPRKTNVEFISKDVQKLVSATGRDTAALQLCCPCVTHSHILDIRHKDIRYLFPVIGSGTSIFD